MELLLCASFANNCFIFRRHLKSAIRQRFPDLQVAIFTWPSATRHMPWLPEPGEALGMPGEGTRRGQQQLPQMPPFLGGCSCAGRWHCLDIYRLSSSICPSTVLLPNSWEPKCWKSIWIAYRFPQTVSSVTSSISFMHISWTICAEFTFSAPWLIPIKTELPSHFGITSWNRKKPAQQVSKAKSIEIIQVQSWMCS